MFEGLRLARLYTIEAVNATPARLSKPSAVVREVRFIFSANPYKRTSRTTTLES
ncbi:hypothetical protein AFEL58S_01727 [Afipia felis]